MIKTVKFILLSSVISGLSSVAWASAPVSAASANSTTATSSPATANVPGNTWQAYFGSIDNHFYLGASETYEYFKSPSYGMGTPSASGVQDSAIAKANNNKPVWIPKVALGYQFQNNFLTGLFGHHAQAELDFSFFNTGNAANQASLPGGAIWYINGGGSPADPYQTHKYWLRDFHQHLSTHYNNFGLYFRGQRNTTNPHLYLSPAVGLIYTQLDQQYSSSIGWNGSAYPVQPAVPEYWHTDSVNESVKTKYFGGSLGTNMQYEFTRQFNFYTNVEVQLLRAVSHLDANQVANDSLPNSNVNVSNGNNKFTYRGILTTGLSYQIMDSVHSPSVNIGIGIDQWGYMPQVYNPGGVANKSAAHIINTDVLNPFATAGITIPLV